MTDLIKWVHITEKGKKMSEIPVLIVGAGPSGLMMALELTRYGIPVRIIDRKPAATQTTNAAGIQTRTIEIFEHIGIEKDFLEKGIKNNALDIYYQKDRLARIPLDNVDSFYNFILMLPQSDTEAILNKELQARNIEVERNVELIELKQERGQVVSKLKSWDGHIETLTTDWVIGCDGYNSTVRNNANIKMVGKDFDQEFFVADVKLYSKYDRNSVNMFIDRGTLVGIFSLPDSQNSKVRVVGNVGKHINKDKFTDDEIKKFVSDYTHGECRVDQVLWSSPFWIHSKVAAKLRNQSLFIAGDAAHVHSPAGAQGMNTGLQDAFNLAWKLAYVIQNKANPPILDTYGQERLPIIHNVIKLTESLAFMGLSTNKLLLMIRNFLIKNVPGRISFIQKKMVGLVTQVSLKYNHSSLIDKRSEKRDGNPKPGVRLPDVSLGNDKRLYDYLRNEKFNLLLFTAKAPSAERMKNAKLAYQQIEETMGTLVKPYIISDHKADVANFIEDNEFAIHSRYEVNKPSICLVRPDQFIALFISELNPKAVVEFLHNAGFKF